MRNREEERTEKNRTAHESCVDSVRRHTVRDTTQTPDDTTRATQGQETVPPPPGVFNVLLRLNGCLLTMKFHPSPNHRLQSCNMTRQCFLLQKIKTWSTRNRIVEQGRKGVKDIGRSWYLKISESFRTVENDNPQKKKKTIIKRRRTKREHTYSET